MLGRRSMTNPLINTFSSSQKIASTDMSGDSSTGTAYKKSVNPGARKTFSIFTQRHRIFAVSGVDQVLCKGGLNAK
jgi:hypothetical protein